MFVKKFESDTLDDALKQVKKELGPDAIILKTVSKKGLKGAFAKAKVEVTAAVSEGNLRSKKKLDKAIQGLDDGKKEKFYNSDSTVIKEVIQNYSENRVNANQKSLKADLQNYADLAVNRSVQTNIPAQAQAKAANAKKNNLEDFLRPSGQAAQQDQGEAEIFDDYVPQFSASEKRAQKNMQERYEEHYAESFENQANQSAEIEEYQKRVLEMERKIQELGHQVQKMSRGVPLYHRELAEILEGLGFSTKIIQRIVKKLKFEFTEEELDQIYREDRFDEVIDFALREISQMINVSMPLFSTNDSSEHGVVTVLISESSSGQSTMALKIAALNRNQKILEYRPEKNAQAAGVSKDTREGDVPQIVKVLGIHYQKVKSNTEILSEIRNAMATTGQDGDTNGFSSIILDYKGLCKDYDETKQFVRNLERINSHVEVLVSLSALHSEAYNRKVLARYKNLADGIVVTHLDLSCHLAQLVNLAVEFPELSYKFFGTGDVIPEDLESASKERILSEIFDLK